VGRTRLVAGATVFPKGAVGGEVGWPRALWCEVVKLPHWLHFRDSAARELQRSARTHARIPTRRVHRTPPGPKLQVPLRRQWVVSCPV